MLELGIWDLNGVVCGVNNSHFAFVLALEAHIFILKVIKHECPVISSNIIIIVETIFSVNDLIIIDVPNCDSAYAISVHWIFVVKTDFTCFDLTLMVQVIYKLGPNVARS